MRLPPTAPAAPASRALPSALKDAIKSTLRATCKALRLAVGSISEGVGLTDTIGERWAKDGVDHHLPVWVLGDAEAVPRRVFDALLARVEDLRGDRAAHPPVASPEAACAVALARGGESAGTLGWALANGKVDPHERPEIRARMLAEIAQCQAVVRSIDEADTADARKGAAS